MSAPIVIIGAGCSGLSLACALAREEVAAPIVVLDRRDTFPDDRTWCFWRTDDNPFCDVATHAWTRWTVIGDDGVTIHRSTQRPYLHLSVEAFRSSALAVLDDAPNVEVRAGVRVTGIRRLGRDEFDVLTADGPIRARAVFDASGRPPSGRGARQLEPAISQGFIGHEVRVDRDLFEPGTATLMDLTVPALPGAVRFMYVLPFGPRRALVEDTTIGVRHPAPADRRQAIGRWLTARGATSWEIVREERGRLPMAVAPAPPVSQRPSTQDPIAVGAAAGAIRGSSGYAFTRIQRHVAAVAKAVAGGRPVPRRVAPESLDAVDTIFLRALAAEPDRFAERFAAMARALDGDAFARFMSDEPRPTDLLRVVLALPKQPFAAAAVQPMLPVVLRGRGP